MAKGIPEQIGEALGVIVASAAIFAVAFAPTVLIIWICVHFVRKFW